MIKLCLSQQSEESLPRPQPRLIQRQQCSQFSLCSLHYLCSADLLLSHPFPLVSLQRESHPTRAGLARGTRRKTGLSHKKAFSPQCWSRISSWHHLTSTMYQLHRHQDYGKRLTLWGASVCLRTAPSSKICVLWSESVKSKRHCVSRGRHVQNTCKAHASIYWNKRCFVSPPQDTVSETANQRTWKVEESEFFHGLRTFGWKLKRFFFGGGGPFAHSWKQLCSSGAQCHHTHRSCSQPGYGPLDWENHEGKNEELLKREEEERGPILQELFL